MDSARPRQYVLLGLLFALLGAFLLYPIWLTVRGAFIAQDGGWTLYHVADVLRDPSLRAGLVNAFLIAVGTTTLSILIAAPLAFLGARCEFPGKPILAAMLLVPLILPPFVGAIGVRQVLGAYGVVNTMLMESGWIAEPIDFLGRGGFWGIVVLEALHLYPIIYLNLAAALANLDPALEEAARSAGASSWTRLRRIVLPLVRPGLFAGGTIVFIWSFTELGTPLMFEFREVTPVQIFAGIKEMEESRQPYALTAVMLFAAVMMYLVGKGLFGGGAHAMYAKASRAGSTARLRGAAAIGATALFAGVVFVAALPHLAVVFTSLSAPEQWYRSALPRAFTLEHFEGALSHPLAVGSIRNSLLLAGAAVIVDVIVGIAVAFLLVRSRVKGKALLDGLVMLPLAVPGLVMAFGYVALTLRWPFDGAMPEWLGVVVRPIAPAGLEAWLDDGPLRAFANVLGADPNPMYLLVIAYAVRRLPYVVRSAVAGLEQTAVELEEASRNLGAGRFLTIRRIVLPLIAANLIAGGLLAFSFAMLEVSDSLILAQREVHYPVTKAIYILYERLGDGKYIASAMGVWGMLLLGTTLVASSLLMGKRMGAIFRV